MIESRLFAGEKLLWSGQPWQGLFLLRAIDIFLVPFSLFWIGFVAFWNYMVWIAPAGPAPLPFQLFGLAFLAIGVFFVIGRFFVDAWLRARTSYAVTTQRVLIERSGPFRSSKSLDIARLPVLELSERGDGSGSIRFDNNRSWFHGNNNIGVWIASSDATPRFLRIDNVRNVYALIAKQQS
ncbi:hypothetical protein P6144_05710 [Sphingomonas sp. HITSZ_GF]|uniref:hypothetical protein n=1 Tax=Sphingomonas sp. HITSZ_GF TaxID=3037247 RepID=UPI00240E8703|nr:hypothetical protein [Sphingomonas sp. HITSZ_GF]MDG2533135.1 hypothetical protein [Sphingomonas sp. HITSZ_GF]